MPLVESFRGMGSGHVRTAWFGTGEACLHSLVSKDRSYKPMVKSSKVKRESDGIVVCAGRRAFLAGESPVGPFSRRNP
jgi:hypothetical protein